MLEKRSSWKLKKDAFRRYLAWYYGSDKNILVTEFPRSGATWFCQMFSEITGIPFPRNENLLRQPSLLHGHYLYCKNFHRPIHILRDGRDVMVSAYHYFLLNTEIPGPVSKKWKRQMSPNDYRDVRANLARFIKLIFKDYRVAFKRTSWSDFVEQYWENSKVLNIKYEDLHSDPKKCLSLAMGWRQMQTEEKQIKNAIEKYDFKTLTGRNRGKENPDSFLRKGIVGDWKNYFNQESAQVFDFYAGDALIKAGYEKNKNWY